MCYLAVCGIGHAPHCGYYRERSWVLIGSWLPGDWVIQEGAVTAAGGHEAELQGCWGRFRREIHPFTNDCTTDFHNVLNTTKQSVYHLIRVFFTGADIQYWVRGHQYIIYTPWANDEPEHGLFIWRLRLPCASSFKTVSSTGNYHNSIDVIPHVMG